MSQEKAKDETYALLGGINTKASSYQNSITEFRDIVNFNFVTPGALTKRPGTTLYAGATVSGRVTGGVEFERLNGSSYLVITANTNLYTLTNTFTAIRSGLLSNAVFDFIVYVDRLFACNGQDFFKFDGSNATNYSLPPGLTGAWGVTVAVGGGLSGVYTAGYGYLNDRGYYGPVSNGQTISLNGSTFGSILYYGLTAPSGYGITSIALYRTAAGSIDLFGTTYAPSGATTVTDTGFPLTVRDEPTPLWFTLAPKYMEIFNNQLFMAGFSSLPSTAYWSEIAEPESVDPTFFAEFRTNDGDRITGLKFYAGQLVVAKERSLHRVTGDNPNNFALQEITDQYGCISNRTMVVYEDILWFLDSKGVAEYNGANVKIVSNKVEPIFQSMNLSAARENATAIHFRDYNEVWFAIPCNGATLNNCVVVYDYLSSAWTKYEGFNPSALFIAKGNLSGNKTAFYGGYSGNVFYFGPTLYGDGANGITCSFQTRYLSTLGQTTEKQFRRFYLDLDPVAGITQPITVNFQINYGASNVLTRTLYQSPFQSRVDFGLPAKSIAAQVVHNSASLSLKVFGYTFESRFQRNV